MKCQSIDCDKEEWGKPSVFGVPTEHYHFEIHACFSHKFSIQPVEYDAEVMMSGPVPLK